MYSCAGLLESRGCPIRKFSDQSSFAAPRNISQRITSFIASQCQGIHQMPLSRLIILIIAVHHQPKFERGLEMNLLNNFNVAHLLDRGEPKLFWKNLLNLNFHSNPLCSVSLVPPLILRSTRPSQGEVHKQNTSFTMSNSIA